MLSTHFGFAGRCKVSVVEQGRVVKEYAPVSNLVLNQGLDMFGSYYLRDCWKWAVAGTGSTATELVSGADTATIVAGAVTLSATGYLAGDSSDVGRTFKLASGNIYTVTAFVSTTQCSVTPSGSEGPSTFTLYNTNQTGLTAESTGGGGSSKRTQTLLTGAPFTQTVTSVGTTRVTRTFDFAAETGPITYNEVGFSRVNTVGSNLFSRVKLPSGVPLDAGQQLRVEYSVHTTVAANTPITYGASPIGGWPAATGTLQHIAIPVSGIGDTGFDLQGINTIDGYQYCACEPSGGISYIGISTSASAHPSYGSALSDAGTSNNPSLSSYVAGTYTRDAFTTFSTVQANGSTWRSFWTNHYIGYYAVGTRFLFDSVQTKLSTHTLTLGLRFTWGRIL